MSPSRVADAAAFLAALATWRVSRVAALALFAACAASVTHVFAPVEPLRWVSALVGLVGAIGFGRSARDAVRGAKNGLDAVCRLDRRGWIGLLLVASMAGDGVALLEHRAFGVWVMPIAQILVCAAITTISLWPEKWPKKWGWW